jgi:hypothetical protein
MVTFYFEATGTANQRVGDFGERLDRDFGVSAQSNARRSLSRTANEG